MKILIAYDGSACADEALKDLERAGLPASLEATVLTVADVFLPPPINVDDEEDRRWVKESFETSAEKLRKAGLNATLLIKRGNPKQVLIEEAESWEADAIFVGAKGMRGIERLLLDSVSAAVAARAHCSVEVRR